MREALLAALLWSAVAAGEPGIVPRRDQLACGSTLVTAQASCHHGTRVCVRETLTFQRPEGRTISAPHKHLATQSLPSGGSVEALEYHLFSWSCVAGVNGGHYLAVVMTRTAGVRCSLCNYTRLYHLRGQPIAATLTFDADGRPRETPGAADLIMKLVGKPLHSFERVYGATP